MSAVERLSAALEAANLIPTIYDEPNDGSVDIGDGYHLNDGGRQMLMVSAPTILSSDPTLAQDMEDGRALRELREALPEGAKFEVFDWHQRGDLVTTVMTESSYLPEHRVRRVYARHHGTGRAIAEAADACRAALVSK